MFVQTDRRDNRQIVVVKHVKQDFRICGSDFSDEADVRAVRKQLFLHMQQRSVLATDTAGFDAKLLRHGHKLFGNAPEHHLGYLHGLLIRHPKAFDKLRFLSGFSDPG